jgi:CDP-diacylglycerol--glycerol-3-phosphate 3-phosphatidyltransferase
VFLAVAWFYLDRPDDRVWLAVTLVALVGGFLVSYARARAEGLGLRADVGIAERTERLLIVAFGLLLADAWSLTALAIAVSAVAVLSWVTVLQRMLFVRGQSAATP